MIFSELKSKFSIINPTEENFKKNFTRFQKSFLKEYNMHLMKEGRGSSVSYYIEEERTEEERYFKNNKAFINDWDGDECRSLVTTDLVLTNDELYCLLVILFAPMGVFRGTYEIFMRYAEIDKSKLESVKAAIAALIKKDYIAMNIDDSTAEGYFTLISKRYIERNCELSIPLKELRQVIAIAKVHNTRSWIPIFKMWAAITTLNGEISTIAQISELTGMTNNQVKYYGKMLQESEVFKSEKVYVNKGKDNIKCVGTEKTIIANWSWLNSAREEIC